MHIRVSSIMGNNIVFKLLTQSLIILTLFFVGQIARAEQNITTPMQEFGHKIGDDYTLITYTQFERYIKKLAYESPRMQIKSLGKTAEGREQWMSIVTSPKNLTRLEEYRLISEKLARAEELTDEEAKKLAKTSKGIVWIDGGLHATEVVGPHQLTEMIYQLVSLEDDETLRFLDDLIILLTHANPDGMELVSSWYMRKEDPLERNSNDIPRLYQKYVGHDNNRDFYMMAQPETKNIANALFREWYPQIMYNHHQSGPAGQVVFIPPFAGPSNHNINPQVTLGNQSLGLAMHSRLVSEGKGGSTMFEYGPYTEWSNGILRASAYYHNQIGILTEIIGNPTPFEINFYPELQLRDSKHPLPIIPRTWHFRESIDYSVTINRALLDFASRNKDTIMYNRYKMGKKAIEDGNKDTWTVRPFRVYELEKKLKADKSEAKNLLRSRNNKGIDKKYLADLRNADNRDPRGYILSADQDDFPTVVKFMNALIKGGVDIHQATADFKVEGKPYPSGSFIVKSAQAYRAQVLDLFEPQEHPDDLLFPGGPPRRPYDNAGWTLAFSMGVDFDRILESFDGPFKKVDGFAQYLDNGFMAINGAKGYLLDHNVVNSVIAVNRLIKAGEEVYWLKDETYLGEVGTILTKASGDAVKAAVAGLGLDVKVAMDIPSAKALKLNPTHIGLWDVYGGSMPAGWTRWILEQYEFSYGQVFAQEMDKGNLEKKYDTLVFAEGAIPKTKSGLGVNQGRAWIDRQPSEEEVTDDIKAHLGGVTEEITIPQLRDYMDKGNSILAIGSSTNLAYHFGVPIKTHLTGMNGKPLTQDEYWIPPSLLDMKIDNSQPISYGIDERVNALMARSPVFRLMPGYEKKGIKRIAWFDTDRPLISGWAWGQERLYQGTSIVEAEVGKGKLFLMGPEILFRAQTHGTFQFLFNGIFLSTAEEVRLGDKIS
ncbi:MAG: M14 family metallopeptidase [Sphingomonadales bacterium]